MEFVGNSKSKNFSVFLNTKQIDQICKDYNCKPDEINKILKATIIRDSDSEYFKEEIISHKIDDDSKKIIEQQNKQIEFLLLPKDQQIRKRVDMMSFKEIQRKMGIDPKKKDNSLNKVREKGRHGANNLKFDMNEHFRIFPENPFFKMGELYFCMDTHFERECVSEKYTMYRNQMESRKDIDRLAENFEIAQEEFEKESYEIDCMWNKIENMFEESDIKNKFKPKRKGSAFDYSKKEIYEKYQEFGNVTRFKKAIKQGLL